MDFFYETIKIQPRSLLQFIKKYIIQFLQHIYL